MSEPVNTNPAIEIDQSPQHPVRRMTLVAGRVISFVVYAYVLIVEIILFLGFLLLLLGANPSSSFVDWVYRSLDRAMRPFRGIFEPVELGVTQADVPSILETSVLFAMIVYAILALIVHALLEWLGGRIARLDREDEEYRRQQLVSQTLAASGSPSTVAGATATGAFDPGATPPTPPQPGS